MWDDNELCEPDVARAYGYSCCTVPPDGAAETAHALVHKSSLPQWTDSELFFRISRDRDFDRDDETWLFSVHGVLQRKQTSPFAGWDVWVNRVDGKGMGFTMTDDLVAGDDRHALVRDFLLYRQVGQGGDGWVRPGCFGVRRPDPLFRLQEPARRLWFDGRWPLPSATLPVRVLTGGASSAGWTDLAPAHDACHRVDALADAGALVAAIRGSARSDRWGSIAITRGGGGTPGQPGQWRQMFDSPDVVAAIREVQAAGICVLAAVGHEADHTAVEAAADFSWATPSLLGTALARWRDYLLAELNSPEDAWSRAPTPPVVPSGSFSTTPGPGRGGRSQRACSCRSGRGSRREAHDRSPASPQLVLSRTSSVGKRWRPTGHSTAKKPLWRLHFLRVSAGGRRWSTPHLRHPAQVVGARPDVGGPRSATDR